MGGCGVGLGIVGLRDWGIAGCEHDLLDVGIGLG
jgi:hypothetical protein